MAHGKLNNFGLDTLKLSISMATSSPCLRFVPDVVMVELTSSWADPDVQHAKSAVLRADLTFGRYAWSLLFCIMVVKRWRHQRRQPSTWNAIMGDYPWMLVKTSRQLYGRTELHGDGLWYQRATGSTRGRVVSWCHQLEILWWTNCWAWRHRTVNNWKLTLVKEIVGARSIWSMGGLRTDVEQQLRWDYRLTLYRLR